MGTNAGCLRARNSGNPRQSSLAAPIASFSDGELRANPKFRDHQLTISHCFNRLRLKRGWRYLSRDTHRVAISNRRLIAADDGGVSFRWKDYWVEGPERWKTMTLKPHEFIRRFPMHVLSKGFHRIRHYGLMANGNRATTIAKARALLAVRAPQAKPEIPAAPEPDQPPVLPRPCPCCGGRMIIIEVFARGCESRHRPAPVPVPVPISI